jgi:glycerate 2-kinase
MISLRNQALAIWQSAVQAVQPRSLVMRAVRATTWTTTGRILVVGCGKAGAEMAAGVEEALVGHLQNVSGLVNVPEGPAVPMQRIRLNLARKFASNFPTLVGLQGAEEMLQLLASAGPTDDAICLISGGGSALLPKPAEGVSFDSKCAITKQLTRCGANIQEMNCVRKHLSGVKGGRLAEAFTGRNLVSFIISDVVGDPLDVIASGPTAPDPSTFAEAKVVLQRYELWANCPRDIAETIQRGCDGLIPETPKQLPPNIQNRLIGNNTTALLAARRTAEQLGYRVLDLGPFVEGETSQVATVLASVVRNIRERGEPLGSPACILVGGETTVTLGANSGRGGRNQEFVLAMLARIGLAGMRDIAVLSAGTDGEDGPTDAAGAIADFELAEALAQTGADISAALACHDAYPLFDAVNGLLRTGPTGTNVTDIRVIVMR